VGVRSERGAVHGRTIGRTVLAAALAAPVALALILSVGLTEAAGKTGAKLSLREVTPPGASLAFSVKSRWPGRVVLERSSEGRWHEVAHRRVRPRESTVIGLPDSVAAPLAIRARHVQRRSVSTVLSIEPASPVSSDPEPSPAVPAPQSPAREVLTGFNNNAVTQGVASAEQSARALSALGAEVDRVQISWRKLEPVPGEYRFEVYDRIYEADLARGIRPLFILGYAPLWAAGDACNGVTGMCLAGPQPAFYDDYATALAAVARRYPAAIGVEVWNEPNRAFFWRPAPDPVGYAALLEEAYAAVKAVAPHMTVAGGSIVPSPTNSLGMAVPQYLDAVFRAGAGHAMDAISLHPYALSDPSGASAVESVELVRRLRDAAGLSAPLWLTETGTTTTGDGAVTEAEQAEIVATLDRRLSASGAEMVLFHTLIETPHGAAHRETGYGLVRQDFTPKPSACVLAAAWAQAGSCPASVLG
jgi:hypothetical protein